jgi:hypothetical protein
VEYSLYVPKQAQTADAEVRAPRTVPRIAHRPAHRTAPRPKHFAHGPKKTVSEAEVNSAITDALVNSKVEALAVLNKKLLKEQKELEARALFVNALLTKMSLATSRIVGYNSLLEKAEVRSEEAEEQSEEPEDDAEKPKETDVSDDASSEPVVSWADHH